MALDDLDGPLPHLVIPAHELSAEERAALGVRRGRGRPRKIALAPSSDDYAALIDQQRQAHVERDPLVQVGDTTETISILRAVSVGIAVESAALQFDRRRAETEGKDATKISTRRIEALVRLAQVVREIHVRRDEELRPDLLDWVRGSFLGVAAEAAEVLGEAGERYMTRLESAILTKTLSKGV